MARVLAGQAQASIVVETYDPARALQGAAAWLASRYQRAELVVISDFQRGQLDSSDVRAVPADVGVVLQGIPVVSAPLAETQWTAGDRRIAVRATMRGDYTDAEWISTSGTHSSGVTLLGAARDSASMAATRIAAATTAVPAPIDSSRAIAIVFPSYANRATLDTTARSAYAPWMVDLLRRMSDRGNDVQRSSVAIVGNRRQLALLTDSAPASMASARIAEAADAALSSAPPLTELEPATLSENDVQSLERQASNTSRRSSDPNGESDARWLWAVVFVLLLIELPLRRQVSRPAAPAVEERARAA